MARSEKDDLENIYFRNRNDKYFMPDTQRQGWGQIYGIKTQSISGFSQQGVRAYLRTALGVYTTFINFSAPIATGSGKIGTLASCSFGVWDSSVKYVSYQWKSNGIDISGATNPTFLVTKAVEGTLISCTIIPFNDSGMAENGVSSNYIFYPVANPAVSDGLAYLQANAKAAWNFTDLSGRPYTNAPAAISDLAGNGFGINNDSGNLTPQLGGYLKVDRVGTVISTYTPSGIKNAYFSDKPATELYNSDFEVHYLFKTGDGQPSSRHSIWGLDDGAGRKFSISVETSGKIRVLINIQGLNTTEVFTTDPVFRNENTPPIYLRFVANFTDGEAKIFIDGIEVVVDIVGLPISSTDPSGFNAVNTGSAIGTAMRASTAFAFNPAVYVSSYRAAVTPILTDTQAMQVGAWINDL